MKWWQKLSLGLIFILAFAVRIWNVWGQPTFISDEASIGYNAYSILKTGKDEWGKFLPLTFKSFGEYKLPVYIYTVVPSIAIFGLNEFSVRFPSVLFGSLTVLVTFFLVKELFASDNVGLISALLLAISPWHIQASRMALEANLGLFITILAALLLFKAKKNSKFYWPSFFFFVLSFYTYNSCRIFAPVFLLIYFLIQRKDIRIKNIIKPMILGLVLILPIICSGFVGSRQRLYKVGIFSDPGIVNQINQGRGECFKNYPKAFCVLRYNRPLTYAQVFIKNYLSHFSFGFLFLRGSGFSQYNVPNQGVLYFWELPFLIWGLIYWLKSKKEFLILLSWLLIAPLANSLTGTAHPVRAILMLPVFQILSATGIFSSFVFFLERKYFKFLYLVLLSLIISVSFAGFVIKYFIYYPIPAEWNWQMGYLELYQKLEVQEAKYEKIYISKFYGEPHIFYLFYRKFDPLKYQSGEEVERYDREDQWSNVDRIGKYFFVQEPGKISLKPGEILAEPLQEFSFAGGISESLEYRDGRIAFLLLTNEKK